MPGVEQLEPAAAYLTSDQAPLSRRAQGVITTPDNQRWNVDAAQRRQRVSRVAGIAQHRKRTVTCCWCIELLVVVVKPSSGDRMAFRAEAVAEMRTQQCLTQQLLEKNAANNW